MNYQKELILLTNVSEHLKRFKGEITKNYKMFSVLSNELDKIYLNQNEDKENFSINIIRKCILSSHELNRVQKGLYTFIFSTKESEYSDNAIIIIKNLFKNLETYKSVDGFISSINLAIIEIDKLKKQVSLEENRRKFLLNSFTNISDLLRYIDKNLDFELKDYLKAEENIKFIGKIYKEANGCYLPKNYDREVKKIAIREIINTNKNFMKLKKELEAASEVVYQTHCIDCVKYDFFELKSEYDNLFTKATDGVEVKALVKHLSEIFSIMKNLVTC